MGFKDFLKENLNEGKFTDERIRKKELEDSISISRKELIRLFLAVSKGEISPSDINFEEIEAREGKELRDIDNRKRVRSKAQPSYYDSYESGRTQKPTTGWN